MPRPLNLHKSYAHRLACRSLYRALLKQCAEFPTASPESLASPSKTVQTLQSLVRYRFRRDRALSSPFSIINGLDTGNRVLSLLQQCTLKSPVALSQLSTLLGSISRRASEKDAVAVRNASFWKAPPVHRQAHIAHHQHLSRKDVQIGTPGNPVIFQHPRPLADLYGTVRKVPRYILANGIPLLKYPGPQPALMNRVLRQKLLWQIKNFEKLRALQQGVHLAETEDDWDQIVQDHFGIDEDQVAEAELTSPPLPTNGQWQQHRQQRNQASRNTDRTKSPDSWTRTWTKAVRDVGKAYAERQKQQFEMGRKLYQVFKDERDLRETERRAAKHERRMARKRAQGLPESPWDQVVETPTQLGIKKEDGE
ncbi:hypothetical protein PV10_08092 [Exophiala mesophila]|uniref:Uncharacterized protein n=1 Tax=Exophiala mesophila TaxID=212818 RepID=A0A0D1Z0R7_EXOME|nr:uncharacterized protein PV10_08092 [Exophiala mesophila]KIV88407.1 hypothetical protein PV10_08092 [Exophiala mesophila]